LDPQSNVSVNTGAGSSNVGVGNLPNARIRVTNRYEHPRERVPELQYTDVRSTPIKAAWLLLAGAVGLIGSLASIFGIYMDWDRAQHVLPDFSFVLFIVFGVSLLLLVFGIMLRRSPHPIPFGSKVLYRGIDDRIRSASVSSGCPEPDCEGQLKVEPIKEGEKQVKFLICNKRPERHRYPFYASELPPPSE
jgi:hypothetical protein